MIAGRRTCSNSLQDSNELLVMLSVNFSQVDVLEIAFLLWSASLFVTTSRKQRFVLATYLPSLASKCPFVNVVVYISVAVLILAAVLLWAILVIRNEFPATPIAMFKWLHGSQLTKLR